MPTPLTATVNVTDLLAGLRFVACSVVKKPPVAIMAGVKLSADLDGITLTALNYDTATSVRIDGSGEGDALVDHARLTAILKAFDKNDRLSLTSDVTALSLTSADFTANVDAMALADYPPIPFENGPIAARLSASTVAQIGDVLTAVSKDATMPVLGGVNFAISASGEIRIAATDRYRLVELVADGGAQDARVLIEWRSLAAMVKAFKNGADLRVGRSVTFSDADRTILTRSIDEAFPRYAAAMPTDEPDSVVTINAADAIKAIKRVQATMTEKIQPLDMAISSAGVAFVAAGLANVITVPGKLDGDDGRARVNPAHMVDAFGAAGPGDVTISAWKPREAPEGLLPAVRPIVLTNDARPGLSIVVMQIPGAA